ncbi:MAG TPA: DUF1385 domain-containing protein [Armatimonadota bacterium]|jgi:uncharacterized protein YqhQ
MSQRSAYGGQAVIEGVMIRGKDRVATACRRKGGDITVRHDVADGLTQRYPWLRLAFLRGTPALFDSMRLGYATLMWSADVAMEGEVQEKPSFWQLFFTMALSFAFAIGFFVLLPTFVINFFPGAHHSGTQSANWFAQLIPTPQAIFPNILEGLLRLLMLIGYIAVIGRSAEIRRIFSYHGAEHKVVNAYEGGATLTVEAAQPYSRIHPRCGTSFIFLVFVVGIFVHALIGWPDNLLLRMGSRLLLLPVVAGVAYELIRLSGRYRHSRFLQILISPGLLLQRLTTAEPSDDQIEVALHSLRTVLEDEGVLTPPPAVVAELPTSSEIAAP